MKKILGIVFLTLNSCVYQNASNAYDELSKYEDFMINLSDALTRGGDYYIYFFEVHCGACQSIEERMMRSVNTLSIYFINPYDYVPYNKNPYASLNVSDWQQLSISGYPTLMQVSSSSIKEIYYGTNDILKIII